MENLHSFFWAAESSIKTGLAFRKSKKVWKFPLVIFFHLQVGKEKQVPRIWRRSKSTWFANRFLPTFFHSNVISSFILDLSPNITICFTFSQVISAHGLGVLQGVCDRQRDDDGRTSHITVRTLGRRHRYGEGNEEETSSYGESNEQEDNNQEFIKWAVIQLIKQDKGGLKNIQYSEEMMLLNKII